MKQVDANSSLETLHVIRSIMERSTRFLTLSSWSGVWAGTTAIVGAYIASTLLEDDLLFSDKIQLETTVKFYQWLGLASAVFIIALLGAYFFTWRKAKISGGNLWSSASRTMLRTMALPMFAGALLCIGFLQNGHLIYIAPSCLIFYGLALYNGGKYTLSEIQYLGLLEILLGVICLFLPQYGLYFWAAGFGVLHVLYGLIMWNKYEKGANT
ncbi:MAG TPA: hypothetical protein PL009_04430 [Flavipsychrobacter sp.]|nr:hypothetical protein [Flavipsychrobacter sp.]